ncbi:MAG: CHAT domain-containing protein [Spirulina sp. SIO3F2]|nr:CHAT domain-containing protein [Spirulina sp. SIO3F2]
MKESRLTLTSQPRSGAVPRSHALFLPSHAPARVGISLLSALTVSGLMAMSAFSQSITPAADGTGTLVTVAGQTYHIEGGTQAGTNLFHSFQAFGLSSGEVANFLSNPTVVNILGRVTGGDPSIINGLIQVTGANSNLYLTNPAGLVFGAGASLNVNGDFVATTADRIGFEGGWFNAAGANNYATLVGTPNQFAFASQQPGAILNFGDLTTKGNVSLVGGTVLNQGKVVSTAGDVTIAAVPGERLVKVSQKGMLLSLEIPTTALTADIKPTDLPTLLTGSGATIGELPQDGDVVIAGEVQGEQVDLYAAGTVTPTDADLIQGDTRVIRFSEAGEDPDQAIFIDARADNPKALLFGAEAGTVAQIIARDENGVSVISEQLAVISESVGQLDSVAIVAEGNMGDVWLGNQWVRSENIANYRAQLQQWGDALTDNADLLLYSCFTALGATGEALVASIAQFTGADVAASVNATGSANYKADWTLETTVGEVEAANPFTTETLANWEGKLAIRTVDKTSSSGARSLRDALTDRAGGFGVPLAAGDTITFSLPNSNPIQLNRSIVWSTDNITIDGTDTSGANVTVDARGRDRIFEINANNATLENLTLQNGSISGSGGGILHTGNGLLTLDNATITNNVATVSGGGIYSANGNVTIHNSTITQNSVVGVSGDGGGLLSLSGDITLTNSTVANNSAADRGGGIRAFDGNVLLDQSNILSNSANGGGGIFSGGSGSSPTNGIVTLTDSTVAGNWSVSQGGGIASGGALTLTRSTVASNVSQGNGGGLYTFNGDITLTDATISSNAAHSSGGGLFAGGAIVTTNATIAFNVADADGDNVGDGGGVFLSSLQNHTLINTIIANNVDPGGQAADMQGDLSTSMVSHSLIQDTQGITGQVLSDGVNGNIIGQDPLLGPLADNGQSTLTHSLLPGSPAIGAGNPNPSPSPSPAPNPNPKSNPTGSVNIGAFNGVSITKSLKPTDSSTIANLDQAVDSAPESLQPSIFHDRLNQFFSNNQICAAIETIDRYHTQTLQQHLGQAVADRSLSCLEMQQQLPQDALMLSVVAQTDQLHLITVTAEGDPIHYRVPISQERVRTAVVELQQALTNPVLRKSDRFLASAQQLYQWLIEPVQSVLQAQGIGHILFNLDEGLQAIPLAALHNGEQFLIETYQTSLIPSLSLTPTHRPNLQDASVLALGIDVFNRIEPLPAVPLELAGIQQQFPKTLNLANEQVTVARLQQELQTTPRQIVHLATHGRFRPGQAADSFIRFWNDERLDLQRLQEMGWSESMVELLVLSSCQTALGDPAVEYGFAGLAVQAQVRSAIAGLWGANDTATMALMREFYRQLSLGQPKGEALRQAQLALLNGTVRLENKQLIEVEKNISLPQSLQGVDDYTFWHPYYWSAFTLIGNPW